MVDKFDGKTSGERSLLKLMNRIELLKRGKDPFKVIEGYEKQREEGKSHEDALHYIFNKNFHFTDIDMLGCMKNHG
jgi:hypothetical protein